MTYPVNSALPGPAAHQATGTSLPAKDFEVVETYKVPDPAVMRRLLEGRAAAMIVRKGLSARMCKSVAQAFAAASASERGDDVQALQVGTGHYGKTTEGYLDAVEASRSDFAGLFTTGDFIARLERFQRAGLMPGQRLRRASFQGREAAPFRAAMWKQAGQLALLMHEDKSQLSLRAQRGFEIQQVAFPVAVNAYASMAEVGGGLRLLNLMPDEGTRRRLGVLESGHPYPVEELAAVPYIDICVHAGDVLIVNGSLIHGVIQSHGPTPRIVINGFIAYLAGDLIQWS
jgi:hypothetical protein